jgi:hypothetical protein
MMTQSPLSDEKLPTSRFAVKRLFLKDAVSGPLAEPITENNLCPFLFWHTHKVPK